MGLFDQIKNTLVSQAGQAARSAVNKGVNNLAKNVKEGIGKGRNHTEKFKFQKLPENLEELKALPEASLNTAFKTAALCIAALANYEKNPDATWEMIEFLNGPEDVNPSLRQFIQERLNEKMYKVFAFFKGATPANNYTPTVPYTLEVIENPYSFDDENWATLYVQSGGDDKPSPIKLRKKPSTGQWFINDIQCLTDIRLPASQDKWA